MTNASGENAEHISHFSKGGASLFGSSGLRHRIPDLHHLVIPNEEALFEILELNSRSVAHQICQNLIVALQRFVQRFQRIFRLKPALHFAKTEATLSRRAEGTHFLGAVA